MSSANRDNFFFSNGHLSNFLYLITLTMTSSILLNKNGDLDILIFFPDTRRKVFNLLLCNLLLAVGFLHIFFSKLRKFPSITSVLRVFIMNGYWIKGMFFLSWYKHVIFLLLSVKVINFMAFGILNHPHTPE